jgi:hypothetical protein
MFLYTKDPKELSFSYERVRLTEVKYNNSQAISWLLIICNRLAQFIESYNESDRIQTADKIRWDPIVAIRRILSVDFDRPLLLISSFNKLVPVPIFRGRSKPPIGSVEFRY